MTDSDSSLNVTQWLQEMRLSDSTAPRKLWEHYFVRLVRLAKQKLGGRALRVADEEDIALGVFHAFSQGIAKGDYSALRNRQELWKLLTKMIVCRVTDEVRAQTARKRGGGKVRGESVFINQQSAEEQPGLAAAAALVAPGPDALAAAVEEMDRLYALLPNERARRFAQLFAEGYSKQQIHEETGVSIRTIERTLKEIKDAWKH